MNYQRNKVIYFLGFYSRQLWSGIQLIFSEFGISESHTELLRGTFPLKAAVRVLFTGKEQKDLIKKLDDLYDQFQETRYKSESKTEFNARLNGLHDICREIEACCEGYGDTLNDDELVVFKVGKLMSIWHNLENPPYQLDEDTYRRLEQCCKAVGFSDNVFVKIRYAHDCKEEVCVHPHVWKAHNAVIFYFDEMIARSLLVGMEKNIYKCPLTGLGNLEQFNIDLNLSELQKDIPLSLVFIDFDDFKALNARLGHDNADVVIKTIASQLKELVVFRGEAYHRSGDEFLCLLKNCTAKEAEDFMKRVLELIQNMEVKTPKEMVKQKISAGISSFPDDTLELEQLKEYCNKAMRVAKDRGKGQIILWKDVLAKESGKKS